MKNLIDLIRATTRPIVTHVLVGALVAGVFVGVVPAEQVVPIVAMVVAYWFADRKTRGGGNG